MALSHTTEPQHVCHFFRLAPELRNEIYGYAVIETDPISVFTTPKEIQVSDRTQPMTSYELSVEEPQLASTCTQARTEVLAVFYKHNNFLINVDRFSSRYRQDQHFHPTPMFHKKMDLCWSLTFSFDALYRPQPTARRWPWQTVTAPAQITVRRSKGKPAELSAAGRAIDKCMCYLLAELKSCLYEAGCFGGRSPFVRLAVLFEKWYLRCYREGGSKWCTLWDDEKAVCESCGKQIRVKPIDSAVRR